MSPPHENAPAVILTGLFLAAAAVATVGLTIVANRDPWPGPSGMLATGSALGMTALAGAWLAMGHEHWLVRIVATLAVALSLAWPLEAATENSWSQWAAVAWVVMALVALPLVFLRGRGYEWRPPSEPSRAVPESARWQYSLGSLIGAMTVVGLLLALTRHLDFPWRYSLEVAGYVTGFVATAHLAIWAATGERAPWGRAAAVLIAAPLVGVGLASLEARGPSVVVFATTMIVEAGWIYAGILVQRIGGYRLLRVEPEVPVLE